MNSRFVLALMFSMLSPPFDCRPALADDGDEVSKILQKYDLEPAEAKKPDRAPASIPKFKRAKKAEAPAPVAPSAAAPISPSSSAPPDKNKYNLFNPTPKDQMRDFDADRPGATDSPRTVDAGHFRVESGIFNYSHRSATDVDPVTGSASKVEDTAYVFNSMSISAGLTNAIELQVLFDSFISQKTTTESSMGNDTERASGFGNTAMRLKWNLFGNDGGPLAMGLIPALRFPAQSGGVGSNRIEGGFGVPFAAGLPSDWSFSVMPQWDRKKNDSNDSYHNEFTTGFTLGHNIAGPLDGFAQFSSTSSDEPGSGWAASPGFGFTYKATPNVQLDAGASFGVTKSADDASFSAGVAIRY